MGKPLPITRFVADDDGLIDLAVPVNQPFWSSCGDLVVAFASIALRKPQLARTSNTFKEAGIEVIALYPGSLNQFQRSRIRSLSSSDDSESPFRTAMDVNQLLIKELDIRVVQADLAYFRCRRSGTLGLCGCGHGNRPRLKRSY